MTVTEILLVCFGNIEHLKRDCDLSTELVHSCQSSFPPIAETMEQIGEPLRQYISSKENFKEFIDVSIDKEIAFDDYFIT